MTEDEMNITIIEAIIPIQKKELERYERLVKVQKSLIKRTQKDLYKLKQKLVPSGKE